MAEVAIKITDAVMPDSGMQDGDICQCKNDRAISAAHVSVLCHPAQQALDRNGLRPDGLARQYYELTMEKRFVRVSRTEVLCTVLATGDTDLISDVPNDNGYYMDVPLFLARRLANPRHKVFGTPGAEVWYGGASKADAMTLDAVWTHIETNSPNLRTNHTRWMHTPTELRHFLILPIDDPSDEVALNMEAHEIDYDEEQPEFVVEDGPGGNLVKKRRSFLPWRDLGFNVEQVLNRGLEIDLRESVTPITISTVEVKPRENIWSERGHLSPGGGLLSP